MLSVSALFVSEQIESILGIDTTNTTVSVIGLTTMGETYAAIV
jgi:hypothetical protein